MSITQTTNDCADFSHLSSLCEDVPALFGLSRDEYALRQARKFIEALTGLDSTLMTFQAYDPEHQRDEVNKTLHGPLKDVFRQLTSLNNRGAAVAVTVNETDLKGRKIENVVRVRAVFADEDQPCTVEPPLAPHFIVHGRDGRRHLYWRVEDLPLDEFTGLQKAIAAHLGTDPAVADLNRAMRLPGFRHWADGSDVMPWVEDLTDGDSCSAYSADELRAAFNVPERRDSSATSAVARLTATAETLRQARAYLDKVPPAVSGDGGDAATYAVAARLVRGFALSPDEALPLMNEWNQRCVPPWSEPDLLRKLEHAEQHGTEPVGGKLLAFPKTSNSNASTAIPPRPSIPPPNSPRVVTAAQFVAEADDKHPSYLGDAILPKGGVCVLSGPSGARKTWLMLHMAAALSTGSDLFGLHVPAPARVLLLECESSRTALRGRLQSVFAGMGVQPPDTLFVLGPQADVPRIGPDLYQQILDTRAEVVILDTHGYFWEGDENSNGDWKQKVFAPLRAMARSCDWGPAFVLVHHFGKSDSGNGVRSRGATAIENDASSVLYLEREKGAEHRSVLRFKKIRDGGDLNDIALDFDDESHTLMQVPLDGTANSGPSDKDRQMDEWLARYAPENPVFGPKDVVDQLMQQFSVSREMARRAPLRAAERGVIGRFPGKGRFGPLAG